MNFKRIISILLFLFLSNFLFSQYVITGIVKDNLNNNLDSVKVKLKNTNTIVVTKKDGTFSINVQSAKSVLIFSKTGYKTQKVKLKNKRYVEVTLNIINEWVYEYEKIVQTDKRKSQAYEAPFFGNVRSANSSFYGAFDDIPHNTEEYDHIEDNSFKDVTQNPLSTFSIDVDNASYTNIRRFINSGRLPDKDAVRIEEMINYFSYDYPDPKGEHPFSFLTEYSDCPWNKDAKLLHIGIQGKKLEYNDIKPSNYVFLIDVSGSMNYENKLALLKKSFVKLLDNLNKKDKISIVVYAGAAGLVLPSTPANEKEIIKNALEKLTSGGSTAGGAGIKLAYKVAEEAYIEGGNNRVILATDGDFNIGTSSTGDLVRLIEEKRKNNIYLTILGFGMGNYKDGRMEQISNAGNGNYFYIDNIKEADKVFGKEMRANMFTIAKDVKIQIEFNPSHVKAYRLIGYVNRKLDNEDFNNDLKDAGELGAGHTVTALYEILPSDSEQDVNRADELKYQKLNTENSFNKELLTLKFRYKLPKDSTSILIEHAVMNEEVSLENSSDNFRFSAAVAGFGMLLRDSKYKGELTYTMLKEIAEGAKGTDEFGYRTECIQLMNSASMLSER
jgi:Ca-activated chloride channel family protein